MSVRGMLLALVAASVAGGVALAQTSTTYHCRDGSQFAATYYRGFRAAYLQLDGKTVALPRRISASGARYSRSGVTLRIKGRTATLTRARQSTECSQD